jgi:hypothetical protein
MKAEDVSVGGRYAAKVSGLISPLRVLEVYTISSFGRSVVRYRCRNERTGREVIVKSPQRFRWKLAPSVQS